MALPPRFNLQKRITLTLVIGTSLIWFVLPSVEGWIAFSPVWLGTVVWQIYRRTRWAIVSLLAPAFVAVPIASFLIGGLGYATGTACFQTVGRMSMESMFNIDRQWRCRTHASACMGVVHDPFTDAPHNYAIRLLTTLFGYMPGAYTGPYPRRDEAYESLALSTVVIQDYAFDGATMQLNGGEVILSSGLLRELRSRSMEGPEFQVSLFKGECLLVAGEVPAYEVFLVDVERVNVFAKYTSPPAEVLEQRFNELFRE